MPHDQTITWYSVDEKLPPITQTSTDSYQESEYVLARTIRNVYVAYILRFDSEDEFQWYLAHDGDGRQVPCKVLEWANI
jgi:hypothetical protein